MSQEKSKAGFHGHGGVRCKVVLPVQEASLGVDGDHDMGAEGGWGNTKVWGGG